MPIYCYRCPACGRGTETLTLAAARGPGDRPRCSCGRRTRRDYAAEGSAGRHAELSETRSLAAGVMPEQAASAEAHLAGRGVRGVRFDRRTGEAVFASRAARLKAIKAMGLRDRDEIRG